MPPGERIESRLKIGHERCRLGRTHESHTGDDAGQRTQRMADGIGLAEHQVPVIAPVASPFGPVAGTVDGDRQQRAEHASGCRALGQTERRADLGPGVAAEFVVDTDDQVRVVVADLE